MEKRKDRIEKKLCIALTILFLIGTPYLIICASWQNEAPTLTPTLIDISPLINSLTLSNISHLTSILLESTLRAFTCSFLFSFCIYFYREQNKSSGFARLEKSSLFGLKAASLVVPLAFPYAVARTVAPILGKGLAP